MPTPHVFVVAVENSADQLGAGLIEALRAKHAGIQISAIGGAAIEAKGAPTQVDISGLSILGFSEALKAYPLVMRRVKETVAAILKSKADAAVLIDSWGFMIRVAQRLKRAGYAGKIIKYVAPQVWAMREGRAKTLAESVDHLLSIHSFDAPYFEKHGLAVTHIGNPMFDTDFGTGIRDRILKHLGLTPEQQICAVLFGSRESELLQLRGVITEAVANLSQRYPNLVFVSPVSETLRRQLFPHAPSGKFTNIHLVEESWKFDVFAASNVAIACSGTVTTQLASVGIPAVVLYKLKPSTWWVAKKLYKPKYISLINISADKALMPELLQSAASSQNVSNAVSAFLDNSNLSATRSAELKAQAQIMRGNGGSASGNAADKILYLIMT